MLLKGALKAQSMVGLMMNVEKNNLKKVLGVLPAIQKPTVSELSDSNWVDVLTVLSEKEARKLIPQLKKAGARGIVEFPLNKVIE